MSILPSGNGGCGAKATEQIIKHTLNYQQLTNVTIQSRIVSASVILSCVLCTYIIILVCPL